MLFASLGSDGYYMARPVLKKELRETKRKRKKKKGLCQTKKKKNAADQRNKN